MKKRVMLTSLVISSLMLSACSVTTPVGTLNVSFDESKKSESTIITDENGNQTIIHTENVSAYVDQLLDSVELPDGASTVDLKQFVYDNLSSLGIDLNSIDFSDEESVENAEEAIEEALQEQGVDTSNMDINLEDFVEEVPNED